MLNGYLFIYNRENLRSYDEKNIEKIPKVDFYKILKNHFGKFEESENHKNFIREDCKIYFYWDEKLKAYIEIQYSGLRAVKELMILAKLQNWSVMSPNENRDLVNLEFIDDGRYENIEDFLMRKNN